MFLIYSPNIYWHNSLRHVTLQSVWKVWREHVGLWQFRFNCFWGWESERRHSFKLTRLALRPRFQFCWLCQLSLLIFFKLFARIIRITIFTMCSWAHGKRKSYKTKLIFTNAEIYYYLKYGFSNMYVPIGT